MRNSKVKGFTLIELIVVIAIIGVLAAILVPSMLGYVRNARISSANANAKQVHTAVASVLTQLGIDNYDWTADAQSGALTVKLEPAASGVIKATWDKGAKLNSQTGYERTDFISYLGENFTGYGYGFYTMSTYSVSVATWASTDEAAKEANKNVSWDSTAKGYKNTCDSTKQKNDAKAGNLYGIYPQGEAAATTKS